MTNGYLSVARESIAMYETVADEDIVDLQHILAVILSSKNATPELTGKIASRGLHGLIDLSVQDLESFGLTHYQALKIHATLILAKKLAKKEKCFAWDKPITSPCMIGEYLIPKLRHLKQEHLIAFYLDTKNYVIKEKTVFVGSLNTCVVTPYEIFKEAMRADKGVDSIIVAHNHPSGNPEPSREDINLTGRLVEAGLILNIRILDHLIIGNKNFISLKEEGQL